ncbi:MAG: 1-phosphofructokinase family hexose kinase [Clostridia bacterium]|nr:1-phosphofructokinase family hexose kinase [Clostridia bacterium]
MIYTVTLNPSIDCVMAVGAIEAGATNRALSQELRFGGKGVNVSRALARIGEASVALGFTAGFTGEALARHTAETERLITPDFIALREGVTRVNVKLRGEAETEINAPGPRVGAEEANALLKKLDALREGDTLVLSGSLPSGLPADFYARMLARVRGKGVRAAVDTSGAALEACLPFRPFLVKPNKQEIEALFGAGADPAECAFRLREAGARNALVSLGADGAVLADETGAVIFAEAKSRSGGCTVGAGDAALAGFIAAAARGAAGAKALDFAMERAKEWIEANAWRSQLS